MSKQKNSTSIVGESKAVQSLLTLIKKVAPAKTSILVIGESGTGKELVAREIHEQGPLAGAPFVPVNCGAIPENLIESELFGHMKGSFTGAAGDKKGLFVVASSGTLFLDEVGELPLGMQVKLLRALQERKIRRVGGNEPIEVDARIIAATNRDLEEEVKQGRFREDLYYRLNVILIRTPALRERQSDIPLLADHFVKKCAQKFKQEPMKIPQPFLDALMHYSWPGNIRELENVIERTTTLSSDGELSLEALPETVKRALSKEPDASSGPPSSSSVDEIRLPGPDFSNGVSVLEKILSEVERTYLQAALNEAGGVKKKAAELLGITFRSIRYRLQKQGMDD